jgi:dihydropteroate synthase
MLIRKAVVNDFCDALKLVKNTGSDRYAHVLLAKKAILCPVEIENIDNRAANILKQEALSCGAEAAVNENVSRFKKGFSNAVLFATLRQLEILEKKLTLQPFGLKEVADKISAIIKDSVSEIKVLKYKKSAIDLSYPSVMGIINLDISSFSGDGFSCADEAVERAVFFEKSGASIIDIGAESSRPGSKPVNLKTEIKRLIPVLKKIRKAVKIPISVDTYKYETAKAAISEGADIINDIYAFAKGKDKLARLIAGEKAGLILMHMKGVPSNMQKNPLYNNCVSEVFDFLSSKRDYAQKFGIDKSFISVDPGIGFGKTDRHNAELIKNMSVFSTLGVVTAGLSRKRFVRALSGTDRSSFVSANIAAVCGGADIIRVHDVPETLAALKLINEIRRA